MARFSSRVSHRVLLAAMAVSLASCGVGGDPADQARQAFEAHRYLEARVHIANALAETPGDAGLQVLRGRTALALGDGQTAESAFRAALESDASLSGELGLPIAHALIMQTKLDEAEQILAELEEPSAYGHRLNGQLALQRGNLTLAGEAIREGLELEPDNADLLALAGQYQLSFGNLEDAADFAERGLEASEESVEPYLLKGQIAAIRGDREAALETYRAGAETFPDHVGLHLAMAAIHADAGDDDALAESLGAADRIWRNHPVTLYIQAKHALANDNLDDAREIGEILRPMAENNPPALLLLGEIEAGAGNHQQAISWLNQFRRYDPYHSKAAVLLGAALSETGREREAFAVLQQAGSRVMASPQVLSFAAELAEDLGDPSASTYHERAQAALIGDVVNEIGEAQQALTEGNWARAAQLYDALIARGYEANAVIVNNAAMAHQRAGNSRRALALAEQAAALTPDDPSVLDTLGWVRLVGARDRAGSLATLRRAQSLDAGNPQIRWHLAQALAANGRRQEAATEIRQLLPLVGSERRRELRRLANELGGGQA